MYTRRSAFFSPLAVVVVAAIGLAAVLLQLRYYNREHSTAVQAPVWLNILGVGFALAALFCGFPRPELAWMAQVMALRRPLGSFAISSAMILHAFRKGRMSVEVSGDAEVSNAASICPEVHCEPGLHLHGLDRLLSKVGSATISPHPTQRDGEPHPGRWTARKSTTVPSVPITASSITMPCTFVSSLAASG